MSDNPQLAAMLPGLRRLGIRVVGVSPHAFPALREHASEMPGFRDLEMGGGRTGFLLGGIHVFTHENLDEARTSTSRLPTVTSPEQGREVVHLGRVEGRPMQSLFKAAINVGLLEEGESDGTPAFFRKATGVQAFAAAAAGSDDE